MPTANALIIGGSAGIGLACAHRLACDGINLTLIGRSSERLNGARKSILESCCDVSVEAAAADITTEEGVSRILDRCSSPSIVVMQTARSPDASPLDMSYEHWFEVARRGLPGPLLLLSTYAKRMKHTGFGRIINVLGGSLRLPLAAMTVGNSTRAGLLAASQSLVKELAQFNVTLNSVLVGSIQTDGLLDRWRCRAAREGLELSEYIKQKAAEIPARRLGLPEEVAALVSFLSAPSTGYITGQVIAIDGGATQKLY